MVRKILTGALCGLVLVAVSSEVFAQAEINEKRQSLMKSQSAAAKAIKAAVEAKDFATVEAKAKDLVGSAEKIVGSFPKGSTTGKTKASAAIWEKSEDFGKAAKGLGKAANELAAAAKAGNADEVNVKVKAIGDSCTACHKAFRAEKYAE